MIHVNGVNGAAGSYLLPPLSPAVGAALARGEQLNAEDRRHLRRRYEAITGSFLNVVDADPTDVGQAGWGVVFAHGADPAAREALLPLLEHRRRQATAVQERRYREYWGTDGYHTATLWDVRHPAYPKRIGPALAAHDLVHSVAFSPDGRSLATGDEAGNIVLLDAGRRTRIGQLRRGQGGAVNALAFSPDGRTLASGGDDKKLILWEVEDLTRPTRLEPVLGGRGAVTTTAFAPDGHTLAVGGEDHMVVLWDLAQLDGLRKGAVALACSLTGGLDRGDWSRYVSELPHESTCSGQPFPNEQAGDAPGGGGATTRSAAEPVTPTKLLTPAVRWTRQVWDWIRAPRRHPYCHGEPLE